MASATTTSKETTAVLLLWPKSIAENIPFPFSLIFMNLISLIEHISKKITTTEKFILVVPGDDLEDFLNSSIYAFPQIRFVYAYYNHSHELKQHKDRFEKQYPKLRFYHEDELPIQLDKTKIDNIIDGSNPIDTLEIKSLAGTIAHRVSTKRSRTSLRRSPASSRLTSTSTHGSSGENIEQIQSKYMCPSCKLVFREPFQLFCGHRICRSCIDVEHREITCQICAEVSSKESSWSDKGFQNELDQLSVSCLVCSWTGPFKYYQGHADRHSSSTSHDIETNDVYTQQVIQGEHVNTTERRQRILSHVGSTSRTNESSQRSFQNVVPNLPSLETSHEENVIHVKRLKVNHEALDQDVSLLRRLFEDGIHQTADGAFIWRISGIQDKIDDAQTERQRSIYSPAFYSSPTGYKLCFRLYLNGDADTRDTHLSLFLVIMRGDHDATLRWPFPFKVKLTLIDQGALNESRRHITDFFWPDLSSNCFRRPDSSMNNAYGFQAFLSLEQLKQYGHLYISDNAMFFKAEIDYRNEIPGSLVVPRTTGSPNDDEHIGNISENFIHID